MQRNEVLLAELFPRRLFKDDTDAWVQSGFQGYNKISASEKVKLMSVSQMSFSQIVKKNKKLRRDLKIEELTPKSMNLSSLEGEKLVQTAPIKSFNQLRSNSILPLLAATRPQKLYSIEQRPKMKQKSIPIDILVQSGNFAFKTAISGVEVPKKQKKPAKWDDNIQGDLKEEMDGEKKQLNEINFKYLAITKEWERLNKKQLKQE